MVVETALKLFANFKKILDVEIVVKTSRFFGGKYIFYPLAVQGVFWTVPERKLSAFFAWMQLRRTFVETWL